MTKRLTIALIAFLALAMVVVLPAAADEKTIERPGDTVFLGEEGLDLSNIPGLPSGTTIAWFAPGSSPTTDSPSQTWIVSDNANFFVDPSMKTGTWYLTWGVAAPGPAFVVADPAIDIQIRNGVDIVNDKTVVKGTALNMRIVSNLDAFSQRDGTVSGTAPAVGATIGITVTDPNGNVYTSLRGGPLAAPVTYDLTATGGFTTVNVNPFPVAGVGVNVWNTGFDTYSRGTYTVKADINVNRMNDNYDVVGKTVSKSYSLTIADDDLTITSNMDNVVRNNDFAVTIEGRPSTNYVLWVKGTSTLTVAETPQIKAGQQGVTLDNGLGNLGTFAGAYSFTGTQSVAADTPSGAVAGSPFYAMVGLNSAGKRTVGFSTAQTTKDQSFTIRTDRYVAPGPSGDYDEVKVRVEKGEVTITASGDRSYYLGEEVTLSGTNTDSNDIYLFITGPNLAANGADIDDPSRAAQTAAGVWQSQVRTVKGDNTWEYKWDTANLALDAGTYTIYAVGAQSDKSQLGNAPVPKYETVSVVIRKGFVSATASQSSVAKADALFIRGNAEGNPTPGVAIWVLGRNFYLHDTQTVEDDSSFEFELTRARTQTMASGQYFVVVQHPMGNNVFDVNDDDTTRAGTTYVGTLSGLANVLAPPAPAPEPSADLFIAEGAGRLQGSDAAEALIQMINMANIDDTYTKLTFLVEEPWVRIDSVGDKTVGSTFTITGTTNLGVDNDLLVEVTSSAFKPTEKTQATEFSGSSGTVKVVKGDAGYNTWSFEVDATAFKADEYIVNVESIEADASSTATFNVLEAVPVTQPPATQPPATQPPATTPPTEVPATPASPGFGALVAIAGLGAVAFLVLRRD
ncbi:MAG: hypothetical protein XE11_2339 [Methanomicrobiales archaeon 53_19]|uniref:MEMAR_RS02690 family S-layer glycoprotein n=1 Tax=Methanocalculus sp. TaxID=2004547 RepID=UPI0007486EF4|nr:MEMAR_RS02690 family S-layer glycoprotein [Methanocalculus sp.]KUL00811.1 MAG: hypothetical protein XE11_2339 [Methanomicrobiales archaeon 53_19]HIJ07468.1 DUF3821 domain-containing protein [Methanocalculus sp.]